VAFGAGLREASDEVIWFNRLIIIGLVASVAGSWRICIGCVMAGFTIVCDYRVSTFQWVILIVIESSRAPVGICRVAGGTIHWKV